MIARMKRAFLVLFEKDKTASLAELRTMGCLHLEPVAGSGESYDRLLADRACFEKALGVLSSFRDGQSGRIFRPEEGRMFAHRIIALADEAKSARDRAAEAGAEIERLRPWGDFDPALVHALASENIVLTLAEAPAKRLAALDPSIDYLRLSETKGVVRIAVLGGTPLPAEFRPFALPSARLSDLEAELIRIRSAEKGAMAEILRAASEVSTLRKAAALADRDLAFEAIRSGLPADGPVAWFSAWIPEKETARLSARAGERGWGLLLDDPAEDELPPTKIENPAIIRLVQPVFDFLGTTPHYREYDISGWFLFFFCFFFALIFGDGGYGALLLLAGSIAAFKAKAAGKNVSDPVRLLLLLAGSTVLWGILTAGWFGLDPARLPGILRAVAIPWFSNENPASGENIKILCFSIGLVQLIVAHLKNIKRDAGSPKFIAQFGQLMMLAGMFALALNLVIDARRFPLPHWAPGLIAAGFGINFCFANFPPDRTFFKGLGRSVLGSLGNIVSVFLGVVNVFADIVSYIRLWAVGLAGLAISQTVNGMAGPLLGHLIFFILGIILLVFGHGLNLIMSLLGVVVHGIRLNMLEFSGHLGMEWSGYKYAPFRDTPIPPKGEKP